MRTRSSPARGVAEDGSPSAERTSPRAAALGRSVSAPIVLALTSVAALMGAVLALVPTLARRRPVGRLGPRPAEEDAGDGDATTDPVVP